MPLRDFDATYTLPSERITLETWSSDYVTFGQIENKIIRTTLRNTILDIKEVLTERSNGISAGLNPRAMQIKYRSMIYGDDVKLGDFLVQERENIRIQVLIDIGMLNTVEQSPTLMNINLNLSNGKEHFLREPLNTTISSIKYDLVDDLELTGLHDIITMTYDAGEEIQNRDNTTFGELLNLDTIPVGTLNIYVRLKDDFTVKLSSPTENILRVDKMAVCLETSISTVKRFVAYQYNGSNSIDIPQIKIIYFGRVLSNNEKLSQIINGADTSVNSLITLHFVINEADPPGQSGGFWSDLRRGNSLFEFLPVEPNPNFEADMVRDRRLRERLAGNAVEEEQEEEDPLEGSSSQQQQPPAAGPITDYNNTAPLLPNTELVGETYDTAITQGEEVYLSQTDTSSTIYQITLNTAQGSKEIKLSSSQAIINNTDTSNPYLMLSPSGFAKLKSLGIDIEPPNVMIHDDQPISAPTTTIHTTASTQTIAPQTIGIQLPPGTPATATVGTATGAGPFPPRQQNQQNGVFVNVRRFSISINSASVTRTFSIIGRLGYHLLKLALFYHMVVTQISDNFLRRTCILMIAVYVYTNDSIRNSLHELQTLLPQHQRDYITRYIQNPERYVRSFVLFASSNFMTVILDCLPQRRAGTALEILDSITRKLIVGFILFFTCLFPSLHATFVSERQRMESQRARRQQELAQDSEDTRDPNQRPDVNHVDDAPDNTDILRDENDRATGVQVHHEN